MATKIGTDPLEMTQDAALEAVGMAQDIREHMRVNVVNRPAWVDGNKKVPLAQRRMRHREFLASPPLMEQETASLQQRYKIDTEGDAWIPQRLLDYGKVAMRELKSEDDAD